MLSRTLTHLVLVLLWAGYFHPLILHPDCVLYADYSDFLAEHLPAKMFLSREWQATGRLPLWNPYHFCGNPFVHDIQVGVFYPPYAVTYLVPEERLGAVLSWVVALHVLLAGVAALAYARWRGLGEVGALVVAVGFMLSAKWMVHLILAGHTITAGLAWLPLVLLGLEVAMRRERVWPAVGAGAAYALLVLGTHPQWTFYATLFAAAWTLGTALQQVDRSVARRLVGWAAAGLVVGAVAAGLTAVQLLPTWEAAAQSSRTVGVVRDSLLNRLLALFGLVGPVSADIPPVTWEYRGLLGVFWLAAAAAAPAVVGRQARWPAGIVAVLILFAVGGSLLVGAVPGFDLFRLPARVLVIAVFPLAFLAGMVTDTLVREGWTERVRGGLRRAFLVVTLVAVFPALTCAGRQIRGNPGVPLWGPFVAYWSAVVVGVAVFLWLTGTERGAGRLRIAAWLAVLLAELVTPLPRVVVRPHSEIYPTSEWVDVLRGRTRPGGPRVVDWYVSELPGLASGLGVGNPLALVYGFEAVNGYNPLDVRYYREFIWAMVGGDAVGVPRSAYALQTLPDIASERRNMFDLLGARFLLCREGEPVALTTADWRKVATDPAPPTVPPHEPGLPGRLPPHAVYENPAALPRAWLVTDAVSVPAGRELDLLPNYDFRRTVLLSTTDPPPAAAGPSGTAEITEYRPDHVTIRLTDCGGGFLVLADVWFPGWVCRVDGREVPVYRANHAFRAVVVPAGAGQVVFSFEPRSYRLGWWVSVASAAGLLVLGSLRLVRGRVIWRPGRPT